MAGCQGSFCILSDCMARTLLHSQVTWLRQQWLPTLEFKSQQRSSSITPFLTPPTLGHICPSPYLLSFSAAIVSLCRHGAVIQELPPSLSHWGSKPLQPYQDLESHPSPWCQCGRHSYFTLLQHWPSPLNMQSASQWPCSTSSSRSQVSGETPPFFRTPIFPVTITQINLFYIRKFS